ncbi:hypothetical protein ACS127_06150 [Amphibacillus sp. Q70]|uniref:oxidoreductase n=1 Tax=Amphibacillus sp. Q70 TaxID=3453416 RepID=UPI003F869193
MRLSDTLYLIGQLANKQLDYLHISFNDYKRVSISEEYQDKPIIDYLFKKINGRVPFIGVGDIRTQEEADHVLVNADLVALGRALLIDPHWAAKILNDREDLVRKELSEYEREELIIENGVWAFLEGMMPERLIKE